jgi:putative ABC transport system permease protein
MSRWKGWKKRIRAILRKDAVEREMDQEMAFHMEMEVRKNLSLGMSPREARRQAAIAFGGVERFKIRTREARHLEPVEVFLRDLCFGIRSLRKRPLFLFVALTTLALGIGGATTVYTIADSVVLTRSPYPKPDRLVTVLGTRPDWRGQETRGLWWNRDWITYQEYQRWREGSSLFEEVAIFKTEELVGKRVGDETEERLLVGIATASLLSTLGIQPSLGRWFLPEEEGRGAPPRVVLGHNYWERRFGSDPDVIGSSVILRDDEDLEGMRFTVIGVAPEGFSLRRTNDWSSPVNLSLWHPADPPEKEIWLPLGWDGVRSWPDCEGIGRLRAEVSLAQAQAEVEPLIRGETPAAERGARVQSYYSLLSAGLRQQILVLALPAALLLLIAFSNMSGLFLGEMGRRRHELATRMALGAGRYRIVAQLLAEAALLGLLGTALGALLAIAATHVLTGMAPPSSPLSSADALWSALRFSALIGMGGTILFAVAPAAITRLTSRDLNQRAAGTGSGGPGWRFQRRLVTLQVAITAILLVQAGLLSRTLLNLSRVELGFGQEDLAVLRFSLSDTYTGPENVSYFDEILARVRAVPGVEDVELVNALPLTVRGGTEESPLELPTGASDPPRVAQCRTISPGYHELMGIPLLRGRFLSSSDQPGDVRAAVVSEFMAQAVWPDRSPLGESFRHQSRWYQVVGVVGDVHHSGPLEGFVSTFYTPYQLLPKNQSFLVARVPAGPRAALPAIDRAVRSIPVPVMTHLANTMDELISGNMADQRYHAVLSLGFGIIALVLAATGILGVAARAVTSRRHEIGVKKALGAGEGRLAWGIVAAGAGQALLGAVMGLALALAFVRFISGFLFGVSPADPATYVLGGLLLLLVSAAAGFIPALRITAIDPVEALKAD